MIIVYSIYICGWVDKIIEKIRIKVALALGWPILSVTCSHTINLHPQARRPSSIG